MRTKRHGFTLLETLVVIVILGTIAAIGFSQIRQRQAAATADTFISLQAREMQAFARAAQQFAEERKSTYTVGARQEITAAQLIAANRLPATFAQRSGVAGVTPIAPTVRLRLAPNRLMVLLCTT